MNMNMIPSNQQVRFPAYPRFRRPIAVLAVTLAMSVAACDMISTPQFVEGVAPTPSEVPTLSIVRPDANLSISQGQGLQIEWRDADRDSDADIAFSLVNVDSSEIVIPLVSGIKEDQDGIFDRLTAQTAFIPLGAYTLRGTINDGVNRAVTAVAFNRAAGLGEVVIQIVELGTTSVTNRPPQVFVREPAFNLSVSQDDVLRVVTQPTMRVPDLAPMDGQPLVDDPFDPDSTSTLYIVLDLDDDPLNDDVVSPTPDTIIRLADPVDINAGDNLPVEFPITIDLESIPIRPDGQPYRIRATITDGLNAPVHHYAAGTINVVRAATGSVDLGHVGRTVSGALFRGFNPGSRLGTRMVCIQDFDSDTIDDFMLVAKFGNPRNFGNIGEAYMIYGMDNVRFGGEINVNSTARTISGTIFEAPPTRCFNEECSVQTPGGIPIKSFTNPRTDGITDITSVPDQDGDGRPDLLIGMSHVDGVYQARDDDPDDDPPDGDETVGIDISMRQGGDGLEISIENEAEPVQGFFGVEDTVIASTQPDINFRAADLEVVNRAPNDKLFGLIKFTDLLNQFLPGDTPDRITNIDGSVRFNVLNPGASGTIHELCTDFDASTVTYNSFGGNIPVAGLSCDEAGVDYVEEELEAFNADDVGDTITVDIEGLLNRLLIGDLPGGEVRLIFVPADDEDEEADDNVRFSSSEDTIERNRPQLRLNYSRQVRGGPFGCYPDGLPNNFSDEDMLQNEGANEDKSEANGFVTFFSSRNRDNTGLVNPDRLESTTVAIELIGQRSRLRSALDGQILPECEADEDNHIAGARFQAGWYDFHDHLLLEQPPLDGWFGQTVSYIEDLTLDGSDDFVISSPRNELDIENTRANFGSSSTHIAARFYTGSITIIPGINYDDDFWRDKAGDDGSSVIPHPGDESEGGCNTPGRCDPRRPRFRCGQDGPANVVEIFAESITDMLGGARRAGDFNLDSVPDLACGAPLNDRSGTLQETGAFYILLLRTPVGNIDLKLADDPIRRAPMLRIRGETSGDRIGYDQEAVIDVNGDLIEDVIFSSPTTDFILPPPDCQAATASIGLSTSFFNTCRTNSQNDEVFMDDTCKAYDFNNDRKIDSDDRDVLDCLILGGGSSCCPVDNGYIGVVFGGFNRDGDRSISQLGTDELPGVIFYGTNPGDRAGYDVSSAGDFDRDGFGDILITAPGEMRIDVNGRERMGVTYLVFGGPHLEEQEAPIELSEIGERIPGIVFMTPYEAGAPDEAPSDFVGLVGDINNDGFSDIAIGVSMADLVDPQFPQGDGSLVSTGRRPNQGDVYIIYGNNIGR